MTDRVSVPASRSGAGCRSIGNTLKICFQGQVQTLIREMVADGLTRKNADYIAYAALARGSYELCGDHLFPKSLVYGSYQQSLEQTSLPERIVDRHIRPFENIMKAEFQDELALMRYCGSKP